MESQMKSPPHVGILCDYGFTILPHAGIGVFVYNLIDGLLTLSPRPQITLLTHPGDQEELKEWAGRWQGRVRILPSLEESKTFRSRFGRLLRKGRGSSHSMVTLPLRIARHIYQKFAQTARPLKSRMAEAGCDVWLVPFAGIKTPLIAPLVLVIFDLVFRHVPEIYSTSQLRFFEHVFAERARESTLIYCGSQFVKAHDLVPCYPFAADRIRVFPLAPPMDYQCGTGKADLPNLRNKYRVGSRFLFYPAALRAHKNHAMLIRALKLLREKHGQPDLELVFTGEGRSTNLLRLVQTEGLDRHVHFLGILSRNEIQTLYQYAVLVPLPSLHEGYGLPLLEALQNECPVVCADIPAFRELLEGHEESVPFFDPHDPRSIAETISSTIARREELLYRQGQAYQQIAKRDWHEVASDFLRLFEEARALAPSGRATTSTSSKSCPATNHSSLAA